MQLNGLHGSLYKLYAYARKQESLDAYQKKYQHIVDEWDKHKAAGMDLAKIPQFVGYSRSTYYRAKNTLTNLTHQEFRTLV